MIFGTQCPKFIYDEGGPFQKIVTLTYGSVVSNEAVTDYEEQKSEINGDRDFIPRGKHRQVEIVYNLFKEGTAAARVFNTLDHFQGSKVHLWLHSDGKRFEQSPGVAANFMLKEVQPFYLETATYKDAVRLIFVSCDPVQIDLTDQDITANWLWGNDYFTFDDYGTKIYNTAP